MTKLEAVRELIWDSSNKKPSKASLKRMRKATAVLDLSDDERKELERLFEYRSYTTGELYDYFK